MSRLLNSLQMFLLVALLLGISGAFILTSFIDTEALVGDTPRNLVKEAYEIVLWIGAAFFVVSLAAAMAQRRSRQRRREKEGEA